MLCATHLATARSKAACSSSCHGCKKIFVRAFRALPLKEEIVSTLKKLNFETATDVQKLAIPAILSRKEHVVINSETGSGKTLGAPIELTHHSLTIAAYLPPIIQENRTSPSVIIAPSIILASQIRDT